MNNFVRILEAEVHQLERALEADPTYIKLREAKRLLALYVGSADHSKAEVLSGSPAATDPTPARQPISSGSMTAVEAAKQVLREQGRPVPTLELLEKIRPLGVTFGGKTPQNSLSSILSKSDEFKPRGRAGWVLVDQPSTLVTDPAQQLIRRDVATEVSEVDTKLGGTESTSEVDGL